MRNNKLQIPPQMRSKLVQFQRRVWTVKLIEGLCAAAFGLLISYLIVFVLDRFYDTSGGLRTILLLGGTVGLAVWFPLVCHKWIWGSRKMAQVAKMLKVNHPRLGDYLLGIIELVDQDNFAGNSEALTRAALKQADRETSEKDFSNDVPYPKNRRWALIAGVPLTLAILLLCFVPAAGGNALQRWLMPWRDVDRFTFTQLESLPEKIVVPLAEPVSLSTQLAEKTDWKPEVASAWVGDYQIQAKQDNGGYKFDLPPFQTAGQVDLRVGDALKQIKVDPQPRPELESLTAVVYLPEYLQRTEPVRTEIRGGGVSIVQGSSIKLEADASRRLAAAQLDAQPVSVNGPSIATEAISLTESRTVKLAWQDELGLSAKSPLMLKLRSTKDKAPELICRELEKKRVIMAKDVLSFQIDASDDYGVKTIGMEWVGEPAATSAADPAKGEKIVSAGNPNATDVEEVVATFSPKREKIEPQTIKLKIFAEDYLPGRPRVYSQPYTVFVLSEDEHAVWMTGRLDDWFKKGLETYEREQQLYKRNVELRNMTPEALDRAETRRQIQSQATAEQAQARRLKSLTKAGRELIKEASRNDQFGVAQLESLAEMLERLDSISNNRMPTVENLLQKASQAAGSQASATSSESDPSPTSEGKSSEGKSTEGKPSEGKSSEGKSSEGKSSEGKSSEGESSEGKSSEGKPSQGKTSKGESGESEDSDSASVSDNPELPGGGTEDEDEGKSEDEDDEKEKTEVPSLSMRETSMDEKEKNDEEAEEQPSPGSSSKFLLPSVTLGDTREQEPAPEPAPAGEALEEAVESQEELLAEFQEVAEELQKLISNLEGSTFVKRLKALSRRELVVAQDVTETTLQGFGEANDQLKEASTERTKMIAKRQRAHAVTLQGIQDDLDAYANRMQDRKFQTVLDEMRDVEAIRQANTVAGRMEANEAGTSVAQAELLADTFDRWAEQLVGPG